MKKLSPLLTSLRPFQWVKNLAIFIAILINGQLLKPLLFEKTLLGFVVLCAISSASYLFNDIIDAPLDRKHPIKKQRPIASGQLPKDFALKTAFILVIGGLTLAYFLKSTFFFLILGFVLLHFIYSIFLKNQPPLDILAIAGSFIIRTFAGEALTGFHIPIWLSFSVVFLSLFIASGKRRSELVNEGEKTRPALKKYQEELLNFYLSTFATATLLAYAIFTFTSSPVNFRDQTFSFLLSNYPKILDRKWLMLTVPFVIIGIMRYGQLIFVARAGEKPEKTLTDPYLLLSIIGWGSSLIFLIYVF